MNRAKIREDAMKLNPIDDPMFCKMAEDKRCCEEMLRAILEDSRLEVLENRPQFIVKNLQGRSVILDLVCKLGDGRIVDVEVQRFDNDDHQKRVLYNTALVLANSANPSEKFKELPNVIVVYISGFDIFNLGKPVYQVDRIIRGTDVAVYNGMEEIYANAAVDDGSEIAKLMKVFAEDSAYDDERFPATSERKRIFKTTEKGVNTMCDIMEKYREDGIAEGMAKGMEKGMAKGMEKGMAKGMEKGMAKGMEKGMYDAIKSLMDSCKWTAEQAMEALKIPKSDFPKYMAML